MFELLGFLAFVFIAGLVAVGMVVCGALTGFGMLFDTIGGIAGAVVGFFLFCLLMAGLVVVGVAVGLFSLVF